MNVESLLMSIPFRRTARVVTRTMDVVARHALRPILSLLPETALGVSPWSGLVPPQSASTTRHPGTPTGDAAATGARPSAAPTLPARPAREIDQHRPRPKVYVVQTTVNGNLGDPWVFSTYEDAALRFEVLRQAAVDNPAAQIQVSLGEVLVVIPGVEPVRSS